MVDTTLLLYPLCKVFQWFSGLENGEIISLIEILVTAAVGIWIGVMVQRNLTTSRSVRDFFIFENKEIRALYGLFMNDLCKGKQNAKDIKAWFKIMTLRIDVLEKYLKHEYQIKPDISTNHIEIKQYITDSEEFNNDYNAASITFSAETRNEAIRLDSLFLHSLTKNAIDINRAKQKSALRRRYSKV